MAIKPLDEYLPPKITFRRFSGQLMVPVALTATNFAVPPEFFSALQQAYGRMTTFRICNPNNCWVALVGTSAPIDSSPAPTQATPATSSNGWIFPPRHVEYAGTQYPIFMSAIAVPMIDTPIRAGRSQFDPLFLSYGIGD